MCVQTYILLNINIWVCRLMINVYRKCISIDRYIFVCTSKCIYNYIYSYMHIKIHPHT